MAAVALFRRRVVPAVQALGDWVVDHAGALSVVVIAAALLGVVGVRVWWAQASAPPAPIVLIATPTLPIVPPPSKALDADALPAALGAFAAPGGAYLGTVPAGAAYRVQARSGADWVMLWVEGVGGFDPQQPGLVWVRAADLSPQLAGVPDMATPVPPPAPAVVTVPAAAAPAAAAPAAAAPAAAAPAADAALVAPIDLPAVAPSGCVEHADGGGVTCSGTW